MCALLGMVWLINWLVGWGFHTGRLHEQAGMELEHSSETSLPSSLRDDVPRGESQGVPRRSGGVYQGGFRIGWKGTVDIYVK